MQSHSRLVAVAVLMLMAAALGEDTFFEQLVTGLGYPFEEHTIITPDGYYTKLFRINKSQERSTPSQTLPVLFYHGLGASADSFVLHFPEKAPGLVVADQGFDSWFVNSRGCVYSKNHTTYTLDQSEFWDFNFYELGAIEAPAVIDYILEQTGHQKLIFIGHSQGAAAFLTGASFMQDYYERKLALSIMLAPYYDFKNNNSKIMNLYLHYKPQIDGYFARKYHIDTFIQGYPRTFGGPSKCDDHILICYLRVSFADRNLRNLERERLQPFLKRYPAGSSSLSYLHCEQIYQYRRFQLYDYGKEENLARYNQTQPPEVPVWNIQNIPVAIFTGSADMLSSVPDIRNLARQLGNVVHMQVVHSGHLGFLLSRDMGYLENLVKVIWQYAEVE